jgi:hypothetical protein
MEIDIQRTSTDYNNTVNYICFKRKITVKILLILLSSIAIGNNHTGRGYVHMTTFYLHFFIAVTLLSFIVLFAPYIRLKRITKRMLLTNPGLLENTKITISEAGLASASASRSGSSGWGELKEVASDKEYIYIFFHNKNFGCIPKRFFSSDSAANGFKMQLQKGIALYKVSGGKEMPAKTGKHLYYWGLAGLIPNFGLITGCVLLYQGIVKYKNKVLIIIGIADILLTVVFWIFMFRPGGVSSVDRLEEEQTQAGLNQIVKNIEFYKMQIGIYPDSLQQLGLQNTFVFTSDYFSKEDSTDNKQDYIYKKLRYDRYTLFSVGPDHIPYTKDDIHPTVTWGDTIKFGWVK